MTASPQALSRTDAQIEAMSAEEVLGWAYEEFGESLCISCSWQKQSSVLVHMISELGLDVDIVELDLFFKETYETRERLVELRLTLIVPDVLTIAEQHKVEGPNLWEKSPTTAATSARSSHSFGRWSPTMRGSPAFAASSRRHARTRRSSSIPTATACGRSSRSPTGRRTSGATS